MNLIEAITIIEKYTILESNAEGLKYVREKTIDGFYKGNEYLFNHDLDALIDYTWQMGAFVKIVSQAEEEFQQFNEAIETIKNYRHNNEFKNTIVGNLE